MRGTVQSWDDEFGWGVLTSPAVPGEIWAHFSALRTDPGAFASLTPGEAVFFTWEEAEQDGYLYRALRVGRPGGPEVDWDDDDDGDDDDGDEMDWGPDVRIEFDRE
ncbi:cold-shock protein [Streptomyces sp. NPDC059009]|uniref:cold-shock protein n=1 Tax=Streptomyces sp. NPDC059009 TaxID=3346694 RepID=UPI00367FA659